MAGPYFVIAKVDPDYTWWEIDGPNNLGDDEDKIVGELNRLAADNAALRAEVERLREALRRIGVALDTYDAASEWWKNDCDAFRSGNRLACFVREAYDDVTRPAPPMEEE